MRKILLGELQYSSDTCRNLIVSKYNRQVVWDALLKEYNTFN